ncbi:MAG: hypothetical protein HOP17_14075, partial [Acidobacteria bacterium]|nr:hypothetical protein [Acidobacteriota bacterium]
MRAANKTLVTLLACLLLSGCGLRTAQSEYQSPETQTPTSSVNANSNLAFGNPSGASQTDEDNYLIVGEGSVCSYNSSRGTI